MNLKIYPNQPAEYVPDIVFEDGTYKSPKDFILKTRALHARINKEREKRNKAAAKSKTLKKALPR